MSTDIHWLLVLSVFVVAFFYASVGHGGASGYLAVLSLWAVSAQQMAASALILNLAVSGTAWAVFAKAGCFSWRLTWPFVVVSFPAAWLGGWLKAPPGVHQWLLGFALAAAAWRLWTDLPPVSGARRPPPAAALAAGAGIGALSGMIGIGGGVFLSPLLILKRWAGPKETAATSAFFILVNSVAGLLGRAARGPWAVEPLLGLVLTAVLGGAIGSAQGAAHFSGLAFKRVLGAVLLVAAAGSIGGGR